MLNSALAVLSLGVSGSSSTPNDAAVIEHPVMLAAWIGIGVCGLVAGAIGVRVTKRRLRSLPMDAVMHTATAATGAVPVTVAVTSSALRSASLQQAPLQAAV
jgi:hypothetical protein